jgi:hypothetical protein
MNIYIVKKYEIYLYELLKQKEMYAFGELFLCLTVRNSNRISPNVIKETPLKTIRMTLVFALFSEI